MNKEIVSSAELAVINAAARNIKNYDISKGHAPKYPNTEQGLQDFKDDCEAYFIALGQVNTGLEADDQKPVKPTVEGLCTSLGLTRQGLHKCYYQRGGSWKEFIDFVRENIAACKWQSINSGKTSPVVGIFDMVNNHNYRSTNEFKGLPMNEPDTPQKVIYPTLGTDNPAPPVYYPDLR